MELTPRTPRTDAVAVLGVDYRPTDSCEEVVPADFARGLECELARLQAKVSRGEVQRIADKLGDE